MVLLLETTVTGRGRQGVLGLLFSVFSVQTKINMLKTTRQRSEKSEKGAASVKTTTGHTPSFFFVAFCFFYVSVCVIFDVNGPTVKHRRESTAQTATTTTTTTTNNQSVTESQHATDGPLRQRGRSNLSTKERLAGAEENKKKRKKKKTKGAMSPPAESTGL